MTFHPESNIIALVGAGWSSLEARRAHNPEVIGSNPIPATYKKDMYNVHIFFLYEV